MYSDGQASLCCSIVCFRIQQLLVADYAMQKQNLLTLIMSLQVQAYLYDGYWEDIGTIEAFYNANLGITKKPVPDFR